MSMDTAAVPSVKVVPVKKTMSIPASRGGARPVSKASNRKKFIDFGGFNFRKTVRSRQISEMM